MITPLFFKYNSLISTPLFSIIVLSLIKKVPDFSFKKHTVSKSVYFFNKPFHNFLFRFNFIIKALLDLGFAWYVLYHFHISQFSLKSMLIIASAILFGSLAYFVEGKYSLVHKIFTYTGGTLWFLGYLMISFLTGNNLFIYFSLILLSIPLILAYGFLFASKTNVFIQAICIGIWYLWITVFVFHYL